MHHITDCDYNIQGTATQVSNSECNMPCIGNASLTCGGPNRISIYQDNGGTHGNVLPINKAVVGTWTFEGCHTDVVNGAPRTLTERFDIAAGVTIESCTQECASQGFSIAGLEFGQECWCGNSFLVPNTAAPFGNCSEVCSADVTELCGAANRLSVYINNA
ncbi:WSC domain-containing protein [Flammula alnicola]|nr:WSC domain-containing protein [Flammula alnicola]